MKLLITGSSGFIGSYLVKYYTEYGHLVYAPKRNELDLTNEDSVKNYLTSHTVDAVIHCALHGRERINLTEEADDIYAVNMSMFQNLLKHREHFKKFINLGTGYEYDPTRNIDNADEDDILYVEPTNPYGRVKNDISRAINDLPNFYTLRLFGIAHYSEGNRFFNRLLNDKSVTIPIDRRYDYFNLEDLPTVIDLVLNKQIKHNTLNCVYENKYTLSEQAKIFCDIKGLDYSKVIIESIGGNDYTGSNDRLKSYNLPLLGLELAMLRY